MEEQLKILINEAVTILEAAEHNSLYSTIESPTKMADFLREKLRQFEQGEISALNDIGVIFLPTSDWDELTIANKWGQSAQDVANKMLAVIQGIKNK